jgi:hypothetical protein
VPPSIRVLVTALWVIVGCNDPPNAASLRVTPSTAVVPLGTTLQLDAVALDGGGNAILDARFTWSSSDPSVLSISGTGLVTAETEGSATITATADGVSGMAQLSVSPPFTEISVGSYTACGLKPSGAAYCWGLNAGTGTTDLIPVAVPGGLTFTHITAGDLHACGVTTSGAAYCWGDNSIGQLGAGMMPSATCRLTPLVLVEACPDPVPVAGSLTFTTLSAGRAHTCGILASGEAFCWGHNNWAQLGAAGDDSCGQPCSTVPTAVRGGLTFAQISAGQSHTCATTTEGAAYCWGINVLGELGIGVIGGRADVPTAVAGNLVFTSVEAGYEHTCGVVAGGGGMCWGSNDYGALGNGAQGTKEGSPTPISGGLTFASISTGARVSCGVVVGGVGYCWGQNMEGTLGSGDLQDSSVPVPVFGGLTFRSISVSNNLTACGVTDSNVGYCWGHPRTAGSNAPGNYIDRPRIVGG